MARDYLSGFEQIVLAAVLQTHGDAYGVTIHRAIKDRTRRDYSFGAIYATLTPTDVRSQADQSGVLILTRRDSAPPPVFPYDQSIEAEEGIELTFQRVAAEPGRDRIDDCLLRLDRVLRD